MQLGDRLSTILKILLPLLVLVVLSAQPASLEVNGALRKAQAAISSGQHAAAAEHLRTALGREPWRLELWEAIAREEQQAGRLEQAAQAYRQAQEVGKLSAIGKQNLAEVYLLLGQTDSALAAWSEVIRQQGPSAQVYEQMAQTYRQRGDLEAAVKTLRAWRAFDPASPRAAYLLGLHLSVSEPDEALRLLVESARADASYTASVQALRNGISQAQIAENSAYGWLMIGRALGSTDQWDLAERAFTQAVEGAPEYAEAWAFLGEARAHTGGTGRPELDRARTLAPDSIVVRALMAVHWRRQGDPDRALEELKVVASQEPGEPVWMVEMGNTMVEKGDLVEARTYYQKAIELAPDIPAYWVTLAYYSAQYSDDVRNVGIPAARQAILLAPNDPTALDAMGLALMTVGDLASAERFLQRALEKDASYALAHLHLGQLYLQRQDTRGAYPYLRGAKNLASGSQAAEIAGRLLQRYYGETE